MADPDIDTLNALDADALTTLLSGEQRVAVIRAAAEAGVAEAQAVFGQMLLDGDDVAQDRAAAFAWFNRAAGQHHLMALNMVGRCYDLGWGVPVDKTRAAECFRFAASRGLDWGMYNYATALALGEGVAEDRGAALDWFRKAAALGNAKSDNYIGSFHEDGWVVAQDLALAETHYRRAAKGGDFRGQFNLARLLGARGETQAALQWLARARETATPAFLAKAEAWLRASEIPALRDFGPHALKGEDA